MLTEIQTAASRIWSRVVDLISHEDDNYYTERLIKISLV